MLAAGDKAPGFAALSTAGELDFEAVYRQAPTVLYFFPRAMTPG